MRDVTPSRADVRKRVAEEVDAEIGAYLRALDDADGRLDDLGERAEVAIGGLRSRGEELREIADEAEDVLDTVDLTDLPEIVDVRDLPKLVDAEEIPEAVVDEDEDFDDAVKLRRLLTVIDLSELWNAADVRSLWREKRELAEEVADVTEHADGQDGAVGADGSDDGLVGDDVDFERPSFEGLSEFDPESAENAIQMQLMDGVEEFRESLLAAHESMKELREENRDRMAAEDTGTNSRNPTAVSTMPSAGARTLGGRTRFSTVPRETRFSTAPNKPRVYGDRFEESTDE